MGRTLLVATDVIAISVRAYACVPRFDHFRHNLRRYVPVKMPAGQGLAWPCHLARRLRRAGHMRKGTSGQAASELMLVVSVAVIAISAAAFEFVPTFRAGVGVLAREVSRMLATNAIGSAGVGAANAGDSRTGGLGMDVHGGNFGTAPADALPLGAPPPVVGGNREGFANSGVDGMHDPRVMVRGSAAPSRARKRPPPVVRDGRSP